MELVAKKKKKKEEKIKTELNIMYLHRDECVSHKCRGHTGWLSMVATFGIKPIVNFNDSFWNSGHPVI